MYFEIDPRAIALLDESISALLPDDYAVAADPSFRIKPRSPFKGMPSEVLKEQMEFDYRPEDLQKYYDKINRPGPKLPLAYEEPAEYYMDPRIGQLMATTSSETPYGGAPGRPLTPEEIERLKGPKERTPPPPGFREQYLPKADNTSFFLDQFLAENQGPSTPVKYYPDANKGLGGYLPNRGAGYPANVRPKGQQFFI